MNKTPRAVGFALPVAVTIFAPPRWSAAGQLPWDQTLLALRDMLTSYIVPAAIGLALSGGGVLYALTNNVSLGVDYKRVDWGDKTDHFSSGGPVFPGNTNIGVSADQVTFQVNLMLWPFPH